MTIEKVKYLPQNITTSEIEDILCSSQRYDKKYLPNTVETVTSFDSNGSTILHCTCVYQNIPQEYLEDVTFDGYSTMNNGVKIEKLICDEQILAKTTEAQGILHYTAMRASVWHTSEKLRSENGAPKTRHGANIFNHQFNYVWAETEDKVTAQLFQGEDWRKFKAGNKHIFLFIFNRK